MAGDCGEVTNTVTPIQIELLCPPFGSLFVWGTAVMLRVHSVLLGSNWADHTKHGLTDCSVSSLHCGAKSLVPWCEPGKMSIISSPRSMAWRDWLGPGSTKTSHSGLAWAPTLTEGQAPQWERRKVCPSVGLRLLRGYFGHPGPQKRDREVRGASCGERSQEGQSIVLLQFLPSV